MKQFIKFISAAIIAFSLFMVAFGIDFYHFLHTPLPIKPEGYVFTLTPGTSAYKMTAQLTEAGILQSPWRLLVWSRLSSSKHKLQAGEYLIKLGTTPKELIDLLQSGKVILHSLTIVPGWNFEQMMQEVNRSPYLRHTLAGLSVEEIMVKLGYPREHPEGRFFADTYYFPADTSDAQFLKRAYLLLHDKLAALWNTRDNSLSLKSSYEALILASIIEKESGFIDEYEEIAGVYTRRLKKGMPLQADPTVIYGAGSGFSGRLTRQMLTVPSPYNTYLLQGLPPTPIAMPSEKALWAAMHPKQGDSLYFVVKKGEKGHVFSKTLEEHQVAVRQYRKASTKPVTRGQGA